MNAPVMPNSPAAGRSEARTGKGRRGLGSYRLRQRFASQVVARVLLVVLALFFLSPIYWMIVSALKSPTELAAFPPTLLPERFRWENFVEAVNYIPFGRFLVNTLIIAVGCVLGAVCSNFVIAYGFSRLEWPGRDVIFYTVLASIFVFSLNEYPVTPITMMPLFVFFAQLGWVNTFLPIIVPTWFGNPFLIFLLRQFLLQIPQELSDAARVDGANKFQILSRVILPLSGPALTIVAIFAFVGSWSNSMGPLIYLLDERLYTLSIGLHFFSSDHDVAWNLLMAASTLIVLPLIVVFLVFQRAFVTGIRVGGIK